LRGSGRATRRALAGGLALAAVAIFAAWWTAGGEGRLRSLVESPETGIRRALSAAGGPGPSALPGSAATLRIDRVRFTDLLVSASGPAAEVVAVADADGSVEWRARAVAISYVGRERLRAVRCPGAGWCVDGERLPRLASLLSVLARRADAFDDADAERYGPLVAEDYAGQEGGKPELLRRLAQDLAARPRARFLPISWQVRIERETAQVGEDYEIALGGAGARRLRARLDLRDEGGRWRITGGL
jgi:hypothetical protein